MKTTSTLRPWLPRLIAALCLPFLCLLTRATPSATQTITLNHGWNAIYVQVTPDNADLSSVFSTVAIDSIWAFENKLTAPDFVQDVTEQALSKSGWRSWVPTNRVDAFQNDLFQIQANRAYLVKYAGTNAAAFTLAGRPALRLPAWTPNAYNFLGFPVDPGLPPTFLSFFSPSSAHYSAAAGLQPIYRLSASGAWQRAAPTDLMTAGEACWVYCKGASTYLAPLTVSTDFNDGLNFGLAATDLGLNVANLGALSINMTVNDLGSPAANPLSYGNRLPDGTLLWPALPAPWVDTLAANSSKIERVGVRRADMVADSFETVLEITDGAGTRLLVPITAERHPVTLVATGSSSSAGRAKKDLNSSAFATTAVLSHVGLWVGDATLNAVSEAHSGSLTTNVDQGFTTQFETNSSTLTVTSTRVPNSVTRTNVSMAATPTGSEFHLRLLLHVDGTGQTRLLKEVIEMWKDGTTTNDANGLTVDAQAGQIVLITDDSKIGQFAGITSRDGVPVGRRISSAGFDFADNELPMSGDFAIGSAVSVTNFISASFARNPFKHRYHPDHASGYDIQRAIQLQLSPAPTNAPPGYGDSILDGIYRETVSGLHKTNIVVTGTFRLSRLALTANLNQ